MTAGTGPRVDVVYTDVDGTMVGARGSFFRTERRTVTLEPARALADLLGAGIPLVLVSGRTRPQLVETAALVGADGFICELGAQVCWEFGRSVDVLRGRMPAHYGERTPVAVLTAAGVLDRLADRFRGRLEFHDPWHEGHEVDVMMRGNVDPAGVERWLAEHEGIDWLRCRDNGVLPIPPTPTLDPDATPVHVYHLMPAGISKGRGVAHDLRRRGIDPARAMAIGDSESDLDMAAAVGHMWLVSNAVRSPHVAARAAQLANVRVAAGPMGLGWAEAVRFALGG